MSIFLNHLAMTHIASINGAAINRDAFLHDVYHAAEKLPDNKFIINLCGNRYHFLVGFLAAAVKKKITLLPPNETPEGLKNIVTNYGDVGFVTDNNVTALPEAIDLSGYDGSLAIENKTVTCTIDNNQEVAIVFTSGTTGQPKAYNKTWGSLIKIAENTAAHFHNLFATTRHVIATIPSQHMYGLECSIMLPLVTESIINSCRPFFPADLVSALNQAQKDAVLVTTPVHLQAFCQSGYNYKSITGIISATAPLSKELANKAEQLFQAPVVEIFGSTETGTLATRRTVTDNYWQLLPNIKLNCSGPKPKVSADYLPQPIELNDNFKQKNFKYFKLLGRSSDLVKIAGKRYSLQALTEVLLTIPGVKDGVVYVQENTNGLTDRLTAFVVAPNLTKSYILESLRQHIDPVFLPRPLLLVDKLPRNNVGKLPKDAIESLAKKANG